MESDETSIQEETSSSSPSSEDENEALFAEADEKAAQEAEDETEDETEDEPEEDSEEDDSEDDADEPEEDAQDVAEGEVQTFEVDPGYGRPYTFKGIVNGNTIVVAEDATQEFKLPGSKKTGLKMAHYKGQLLPLSSYERFIKGE